MMLRSRLLFVFLLCWLMVSLALAIEERDSKTADYLMILAQEDSAQDNDLLTAKEFDYEWQTFASWPEQDYSDLSISSLDLTSFVSDTIFLDGSFNPGSSINSKNLVSLGRDYLSKTDLEIINLKNAKTPETGKYLNRSEHGSDVNYIYEREVNSNWQGKRASNEIYHQLYFEDLEQHSSDTSGNKIQFAHGAYKDYFYRATQSLDDALLANSHEETCRDSMISNYQELVQKLASNAEYADEDHGFKVSNFFDPFSSSPKLLGEISKPLTTPAQGVSGINLTAGNLNRLVLNYGGNVSTVSSANSSANINSTYIPEYFPSHSHKQSRQKNYAVIVGIDEYKDRTSLHKCVNDANSIADLMKTLGYEVILLSDNSEKKPTKRNILDVALKDINQKQPNGNIIFYFSGHGMLGHDNTFYLIPQDSNGDTASYISEYELKRYIKDLDNLALIIDACDSEGLSDSIGKGQLIIASSKKNEASNEEWTGSLSVFTSRLIGAIREEGLMSNKILLQKCFYRAYNDTVKWGQGRLLRQTPVLIDRSGGRYYIR